MQEIVQEIDEDGSGSLEFPEFIQLAAKFLIEEDEEQMRWELREALLRERIPSGWRGCSRPGAAVTAGEIEALKSTLGSDEAREQKHASLLRYADLAARGLSPDHSRGWDFLVAAEEVVLHVALDGEELPTQYLLDLAARIKRERLDCLSRADVARLAFVAHVVVSLKYGPEGAAARLESLRDFLVELRPEGEGEVTTTAF